MLNGKRLRPVALVDTWLAAAGITDGLVFRRFVRRAAAAGLDAAEFSGHSLRSDFLTAAARAGASIWKMQEVSRHKSVQVLSGNVRSAELFDDYAGSAFL